MRVLFTYYLEGDLQKKICVKEGNSFVNCENKLKEQYPNITRIEYSNVISSATEGSLYGPYMLCNSK